MAKALRVFSKITAIASTVFSFIPGGQAISAALAVTSAVSGTIGAALKKKPKAVGSTAQITIGANQPIPIPLGRTYIAGALVHDIGWGGKVNGVQNPYRALTFVNGMGPIDGFENVMFDFSPIAFAGNTATGYYSGFVYKDELVGAFPAPRALVAQWSGEPNWSPAHKLSGYAATKISIKFDKNGKVLASGVPQIGRIVRGILAYDPRLDSSYPGGAGTHRINDEATWAWTKSPALIALRYALNTMRNGVKIAGVGLDVSGIDLTNLVAWANICELNEWECNGVIFEPADRWNNLKLIAEAGGAEPVLSGGVLHFDYWAARSALDTITVDDLADGEMVIPATQFYENRYNGGSVKYISEDHRWEPIATDMISVASYEAADGEEKLFDYSYQLVTKKNQAAQLLAYEIVESREIGPITFAVKPRLWRFRRGQVLALNIPDLPTVPQAGLANQLVKIIDRSIDPETGAVNLSVMTETASKHAFALGQTTDAPPPAVLTPPWTADAAVNDAWSDLIDADLLTIPQKIALIASEASRQEDFSRVRARIVELMANAAPANLAALVTQLNALDAESAAWLNYRNAIAPLWNDTSANSPIVRATYNIRTNAYDAQISAANQLISQEDARRSSWSGVVNDDGTMPEDSATRGVNLIYNGDAEAGDTAGWLAHYISSGANVFTVVDFISRTGSQCFFSNKQTTSDVAQYASRCFAVQPGEVYRVKISAVANISSGAGTFQIRMYGMGARPASGFVNSANYTSFTDLHDAGIAGAWVDYDLLWTVPNGVRYASLNLVQWVGAGNFMFWDAAEVKLADIQLVNGALTGIGSGNGTQVANSLLVPSIADAATRANWPNVIGPNRPADNATVGSTSGVNTYRNNGTLVNDSHLLNENQQLSQVIGAGALAGLDNIDLATGPLTNQLPVGRAALGLRNDQIGVDAAGNFQGGGFGAGVEVDNNLVLELREPSAKTFTANHQGILDANQLPETFIFRLFRGVTNVSTTTTWAVLSQTGISGGVVTISNGVATIPAGCTIALSASIQVSATRNGVTRYGKVDLARQDAAQPGGSGGGASGSTSNSDNTLNTVNSTSMIAISDEMAVSTSVNGLLTFSGSLSLDVAAMLPIGSFGAKLRWRYKLVGGNFSDVGASDIDDQYPAFVYEDTELGGGVIVADQGLISANASQTGLAASTQYIVQLWGARDSASPAKDVSFGGQVFVNGS
jgi:hypothetical protein